MANSRPFLITPYVQVSPDEAELRPIVPQFCPHMLTDDSTRTLCKIELRHRRRRKTGPGYPLSVMCCTAHACTFTLYPPGFAPYQRKPVLKLSPCGHRVFGEGDPLETDFESTMFEGAVIDTSKDRHRPRSALRAARIVGVACDLAARLREQIASALSVSAGPLHWLSRSSKDAWASTREILTQLNMHRGYVYKYQARDLLVSGCLAGYWGEPLLYLEDAHDVHRSPNAVLVAQNDTVHQGCVSGRPSPRNRTGSGGHSARFPVRELPKAH